MTPYRIFSARGEALPVVASIPHTGVAMPAGYARRLASDAMRGLPMTDWHMAKLFDFLPSLGVTVIAAEVSRFVIDLNRPPGGEALYPGRYETGLVPRRSFDGSEVFADPPTEEETETARRGIYEPYHRALAELRARSRAADTVIQLDLHSVTPAANRISGPLANDIMLGDRDGRSCAAWLTETVREAYLANGFSVAVNAPYKGGWITESGGRETGVEALQIEMSWAVYLDPERPGESSGEPLFDRAQGRLRTVFERFLPAAVERLRQG
ncbi:MAG: N-formylglutamate amidohydrolase [Gammaproteobacteria bacterium]|nr:N-formylglutamate amidohydrolase [Gammaproteobacteria bacterium]